MYNEDMSIEVSGLFVRAKININGVSVVTLDSLCNQFKSYALDVINASDFGLSLGNTLYGSEDQWSCLDVCGFCSSIYGIGERRDYFQFGTMIGMYQKDKSNPTIRNGLRKIIETLNSNGKFMEVFRKAGVRLDDFDEDLKLLFRAIWSLDRNQIC